MNYTEMLLALVGGGFGVKGLEILFFTKKDKQDSSIQLIAELQKHVNFLSKEVIEMRKNLDKKTTDYLELQREHANLLLKYDRLKSDLDRFKKKYPELITDN